MELRENLSEFELIVIKFGSNVITDDNSELDLAKMTKLVSEIAFLRSQGKKVVLISSGAINAGKKILNLNSKDIDVLQAQSSIGQPILMSTYSKLFQAHELNCAQLLLTHDDFKNRQRFLNARNTISTLLKNDLIPILNENDSVSFTEITVGDNDHLAAMTAQMLGADVLLLITSTNGVYDDDPSKSSSQRIPRVKFDDKLAYIKTSSKSKTGRGGMASKVKAIQKVTPLGITGIVSPKDIDSPILSALSDTDVGTVFLANKKVQTHQRKAWLISTQKQDCFISVDEGAYNALIAKKSLLPKGIHKVSGIFSRGDCVAIKYQEREFALGVVEYSKQDLIKIIGKNSSVIEQVLGFKITDEAVHKNNLLIKDN